MSSVTLAARKRPTRRPALAFGVIATLVSLAASWRPSLWTDEAATISGASRSLPELVAMAHNVDSVHATYYGSMHFWVAVLPVDAFLLRLPSALAVGLSAAGIYLIGIRLGGRHPAWTSSVVFAILPRSTWMGMEARPYALASLLCVAATAVLLRGIGRNADLVGAQEVGAQNAGAQPAAPRRPMLALYALLVGLGIAVNVYVALVVVGHGVSVLASVRSTRHRLAWLAAAVSGVALSSGVVWVAIHQTGQLGSGDLSAVTLLRSIVVNQWFLGETPTLTVGTSDGGDLGWKVASVLLAGVGWSLVVAGLFGARSHTRFLRGQTRRVAIIALPWVVLPTAVVSLYSLLVHDLYNPRYFSLATGGVALLVGHGIVVVSRVASRRGIGLRPSLRVWTMTLLAALLVLSAPVYVSQRGVYAKSGTDWSRAAAFIAAHPAPGSGVYFSPRFTVVGTTVGPTARGIQVAYPDAFAGLHDITLLRTPLADDNLTGTSRLLRDCVPELAAVDHLWVVRRVDYTYSAPDDAVLNGAGLQPDLRWQGPLDQVIRYSRPANP